MSLDSKTVSSPLRYRWNLDNLLGIFYIPMGKFHRVKSLVVNRNWGLTLLSKIWLFWNLVKHQKFLNSKEFKSGCWVIPTFVIFSHYKTCKAYCRPTLPLGVAETCSWFSPMYPVESFDCTFLIILKYCECWSSQRQGRSKPYWAFLGTSGSSFRPCPTF